MRFLIFHSALIATRPESGNLGEFTQFEQFTGAQHLAKGITFADAFYAVRVKRSDQVTSYLVIAYGDV